MVTPKHNGRGPTSGIIAVSTTSTKTDPSLSAAIDAVLLAGQDQRDWLERNPHPPLDASLTEAVAFYGGPRAALSLWKMVRAVEGLRGEVARSGG